MKFKLEMNLDNAAFEGELLHQALANTLRELADGVFLLEPDTPRSVYDFNGNSVGTMIITDQDTSV